MTTKSVSIRKVEWIQHVIDHPMKEEIQAAGMEKVSGTNGSIRWRREKIHLSPFTRLDLYAVCAHHDVRDHAEEIVCATPPYPN